MKSNINNFRQYIKNKKQKTRRYIYLSLGAISTYLSYKTYNYIEENYINRRNEMKLKKEINEFFSFIGKNNEDYIIFNENCSIDEEKYKKIYLLRESYFTNQLKKYTSQDKNKKYNNEFYSEEDDKEIENNKYLVFEFFPHCDEDIIQLLNFSNSIEIPLATHQELALALSGIYYIKLNFSKFNRVDVDFENKKVNLLVGASVRTVLNDIRNKGYEVCGFENVNLDVLDSNISFFNILNSPYYDDLTDEFFSGIKNNLIRMKVLFTNQKAIYTKPDVNTVFGNNIQTSGLFLKNNSMLGIISDISLRLKEIKVNDNDSNINNNGAKEIRENIVFSNLNDEVYSISDSDKASNNRRYKGVGLYFSQLFKEKYNYNNIIENEQINNEGLSKIPLNSTSNKIIASDLLNKQNYNRYISFKAKVKLSDEKQLKKIIKKFNKYIDAVNLEKSKYNTLTKEDIIELERKYPDIDLSYDKTLLKHENKDYLLNELKDIDSRLKNKITYFSFYDTTTGYLYFHFVNKNDVEYLEFNQIALLKLDEICHKYDLSLKVNNPLYYVDTRPNHIIRILGEPHYDVNIALKNALDKNNMLNPHFMINYKI